MLIPINWIVFACIQLIVFLAYRYYSVQDKTPAISRLFANKTHFLLFNGAVFFIAVLINLEHQLFCIPVTWAAILLILFAISFLLFPFIQQKTVIAPFLAFFSGIGIFIAIYLILFGRWEYLIILVLNLPIIIGIHYLIRQLKKRYQKNYFDAFYLYPALLLAPFLLLYQLWLIFKSATGMQKKFLLSSPLLLAIIFVGMSFRINYLVSEIKSNQAHPQKIEELIDNPIDHYLTELILGAHWKYHTQLCLYDGWRPPYHDPVLVVANKLFNPSSKFDQGMDWPKAKSVYHELYPNNPTEFECKCAKNELLFRY